MTVVAQLGIGARAKMQMAATGDRGFRLPAMLPRRRALKLHATWCSKPVGDREHADRSSSDLRSSPPRARRRSRSHSSCDSRRRRRSPSMPPNALVLARQAGSLAVGLALQPKRSTTTLVATVLGPDGSGVSGLDASLTLKTAGGAEASGKGRACGPGCYEATLTRTTGRPSAATVTWPTERATNRRRSRYQSPGRHRPQRSS